MVICLTMALASSLLRGGGAPTIDGEDGKYSDAWRPYGNGRRGLEEDYKSYSSKSQSPLGNVFTH
ncbi:hypothetical protein DFJ58DRAFT_694504 [Suillus subalutaceus]|uniref:uncharacterized protein n=1 Tax=Suillus subalutaceus TaxID=48586 RepID=UPI001B863D47|nr:uncharacterized protein DFJ58DRAFT_694504 [Suillus subalutaceus]KAG1875377.1 hypothetical protein DFJ58DRAFT_694504 [Suillus subalutaceus]